MPNTHETTHRFFDTLSQRNNSFDDRDKHKSSCNSSANSDLENLQDQELYLSDCESVVSGHKSDQISPFNSAMVKLVEGDRARDFIKTRFVSCLGLLGQQAKVVAIHRNSFSGFMGQAMLQSFRIYLKAMEKNYGGNANVKFAWYGGCGKDDAFKVLEHGFGACGNNDNNGWYGRGVYLAPHDFPMECVKNVGVDKDGLRHLLLCRVILGKVELVPLGSDLCHPSSKEFDSGVDNLALPKKYIVWNTRMNTHILPEYIISFKAPSCLKEFFRVPGHLNRPISPWIPFPTLIAELSKFLPPPSVALISKSHRDYKEHKILRHEFIHLARKIAGDKLLISVIKSFRAKCF
ncbi:RST domain-containing protein [Cephalotus follicularis]|uniref:RST domain-containing protein n=1 Tax=Cephalotus follicularis TaxID=3775 RepID=A0A1Q3B7F9_CEPFO|nr:RST domain-containing protein [Cephalotus follicularis]